MEPAAGQQVRAQSQQPVRATPSPPLAPGALRKQGWRRPLWLPWRGDGICRRLSRGHALTALRVFEREGATPQTCSRPQHTPQRGGNGMRSHRKLNTPKSDRTQEQPEAVSQADGTLTGRGRTNLRKEQRGWNVQNRNSSQGVSVAFLLTPSPFPLEPPLRSIPGAASPGRSREPGQLLRRGGGGPGPAAAQRERGVRGVCVLRSCRDSRSRRRH